MYEMLPFPCQHFFSIEGKGVVKRDRCEKNLIDCCSKVVMSPLSKVEMSP